MRFSIKHLLLFISVWAITLALIPYAPWVGMRVSYYHTSAINDVREIHLLVMSTSDELPISFDMLRKSDMWPTVNQSTDAWGHSIQIIESERKSKEGYDCGVHVFSLGADGVSATLGNDPDDINTWDDHHYAFYHSQIRNEEMMARLRQSIWLAPLLYLILLAIIWTIRSAK